MFIYIGNDEVVESRTIIAILEIQLYHSSPQLRKLINDRKKMDSVFGSMEDAKSIIVTKDSIYYSPLATSTLKKREQLYRNIN